MSQAAEISTLLQTYAHPEKAVFFPRFFKCGPGQYGEGDSFLGITVPDCRKVAKQFYKTATLDDVAALLASSWHEERLTALLLLVLQYPKATPELRREMYEFYLEHTTQINNWDLVDLSSRDIVGWHIYDNPTLLPTLDKLAKSKLLWDRRIAIVSTFYFIQKGDPQPTLHIAEMLLGDTHDLIHKASGWMLREAGKRIDLQLVPDFVKQHHKQMPRTMLRYAIEHFPAETRAQILAGKI